jgi:tetratricopeptide (TPR) repeat protein
MIAVVAMLGGCRRGGEASDGIAVAQALVDHQRDDEALAVLGGMLDGGRPAEARRAMAAIYLRRKQVELAEQRLGEALAIDQRRGDHAAAYADLAPLVTMRRNRDDYPRALQLANQAASEAEASGDRTLHGRALVSIGSVLQGAGDYERALDAYRRAGEQLPPDARKDRARVLIYRAVLLGEQRQHALARPLLEDARRLAIEIADHMLVLSAEINLADIALARRDLEAAARHLDEAQRAWQASGATAPSQGLLFNRAILARRQGDLAAATRAIDALAAADPSPDTSWVISHERGLTAQAAGDLDAAERHYLAAIDVVEAMWRSASTDDLKAPLFEDRWLPYQSLIALRLDRGAVEPAFATLVQAQGRMFLSEAAIASAGASIERRERLRTLLPLVAAAPIARSIAPTETLRGLRDHYVLDYFAAGGQMRLVAIDRGTLRATRVKIELPALDKLIDDFLAHSDDRGAAKALGDALLPPAVIDAAPRRIHVIPDAALQRVPFAALIAGGARLVDRHEIVYSPSATGLASLDATAGASAAGASAGRSPVLLGDPQRNLRHAADEVRAVAAATGAVAKTGSEATVAALQSARDASLLHVIGHSGVDPGGGYLVMADGKVSAAQIVTWQLRPHLAVLPTCASAASNRRDMWGSLAAAFLAAGSVDVVSTLYTVDDSTAAEFVGDFYRHGGANDPVAATAAAQRELAGHTPVLTWSAFIVIGL